MSKHLHIVAFNVPWPADYGGVIDVYYRCRALAREGVRVHLHCYSYGRPPAKQLEDCCEEVCYYERDMSPLNLLTRRPFIVSSRQSKQLLARLEQDDYPVLLEGLHCCWLLEEIRKNDLHRVVIVRAHNVEHDYYALLSKVERKPLKRPYLRMEAHKLERYEMVLRLASRVLAVTEADAAHFSAIGCPSVMVMTSSHCYEEMDCREGRGDYVFYHGNLSVSENVDAVKYLVENVLSDGSMRFVVAGREPHQELLALAERYDWMELKPDPDDATMKRLLQGAQVVLLFTAQPTGLKLKLLNSLYSGRFCVVNSAMVSGTRLGEACIVADDPQAMREALARVYPLPFGKAEIEERRRLMGDEYDNASKAMRLIELL